MEKIDMVLDLQYGSTGKGLIVGYLAWRNSYDTVITAWAPNAGHTFIDHEGRKFIHTHLANGVVSKWLERIMLGPGSLINPRQLLDEIGACSDLLAKSGARIIIHPHAAVVSQRHVDEEAGPMTKIGSTKKGVGAAMIQRIRRDPDDQNVACMEPLLSDYVVTVDEYQAELARARMVLIEGAQGFGLSMYHGFYPYTTSRDVSVWQIYADCGIPYMSAVKAQTRIIGTCRTYPIRVANRFDTRGTQIGYSGPVYDDQVEVSFEYIGQKTELTTVTKLPRRIFTFSKKQIRDAIRYNGARVVFLNFVNYVREERELVSIIRSIESEPGVQVGYIGVGPTAKDVRVIDVFDSANARMEQIISIWRDKCFK